jgi:hypothetical protein
MFNPNIVYYNLMNVLKKKDEEEEEDIQSDLSEGFFRNPWFVFVVIGLVYFKLLKQ